MYSSGENKLLNIKCVHLKAERDFKDTPRVEANTRSPLKVRVIISGRLSREIFFFNF